MRTPEEEDADVSGEAIAAVAKARDDYRRAQRRIIARWRGLLKNGAIIEDAEEARRVLRSYSASVAACDRWFKANG